MPYISESIYEPNRVFQNGHLSTILYGLLRDYKVPAYKRDRLQLPDGDFILVDAIKKPGEKAVIICHGLEGNSRKNYNNVCANYFIEKNYAVFAWNNRSCGGEMNKLPKLYHHGAIDELQFVINYVEDQGYSQIYLVGFSLGGTQILNLLGKQKVSVAVKAAVAISSPYQLKSSAQKIQEGFSKIYLNRFIRKVKSKIILKAIEFPELISFEEVKLIKDFDDVIEKFVIPVHGGYNGLEDYYKKASPAYAIDGIETPVLIINALNDPILGDKDHPVKMAEGHEYVYLETPEFGGHCAFPHKSSKYPYSVLRTAEFFKDISGDF